MLMEITLLKICLKGSNIFDILKRASILSELKLNQ